MTVDAIAVRFQLLPDVVDISLIPTGSGLCGLIAACAGACARLDPDRLGRVVLLGNLVGGASMAAFLIAGVSGVFS